MLAQATASQSSQVASAGLTVAIGSIATAASTILLALIKGYWDDRAAERAAAERRAEREANIQGQLDQQRAESERQKAEAVEQRREAAEAKARAKAAEAKAHQAATEAKLTKGRLAELESKANQVADKVDVTVDKVVATQTVAAGNQGDLEGLKERISKQGVVGPILQGQTRLLPTILVVEDDKDTMEVVCKRFSAAGFSVTKAPDLSEASYQIAKGPHWVFTDVKLLGGQDGLDLVRLIRRDELPINVVVCSGYVDDPAVRAKLDSLRPDVVVGKPLMDADFDRLLDRMRTVPRAAGRGGGRSDGPRPA